MYSRERVSPTNVVSDTTNRYKRVLLEKPMIEKFSSLYATYVL